jgi:hypothetical protein
MHIPRGYAGHLDIYRIHNVITYYQINAWAEMTTPPVLILDNGAYTIKAGFSGIDFDPRVFPNSIARSRAEKKVYVADEIENCRDHSGIVYRRPFERVSYP